MAIKLSFLKGVYYDGLQKLGEQIAAAPPAPQ